jgi:diguanylate cyclase (GGDEF)-like protein/PAS domain S-box-containing protein
MPVGRLPWFNWRSLRTRLTVGVLAAVVVSFWGTALLLSYLLRIDMERELLAQQFSTVSLLAQQVDRSLRERQSAVEGIAAAVTPTMMADPGRLQVHLEQRVSIPLLFNWGALIVDTQGIARASLPAHLERTGVDYSEVPAVRRVLDEGVSLITDPMLGKQTGQPVFTIMVPIRDSTGRTLGAVLGITNLALPNFLDDIGANKYGMTGDFFVTAPRTRFYVASSDRRRIMAQGPAAGVNPVYDRYIDGYEGSGGARSSRGVVELSSSRRIASSGWLMQSVLPADEAFAPVREMQRHLLVAAIILTVLAVMATTWWLRWQLQALEEAAGLLRRMGRGELPRQVLPVRREDEIGQVARAFNGLLAAIESEEAKAAEHAANEMVRKIVANVPGMVFQYRLGVDGTGCFPFASNAIEELYGVSAEEVRNNAGRIRTMLHPDDEARFFTTLHESAQNLTHWRIEYRIRQVGGGCKWLQVDALPERGEDGTVTWYGFVTNVSERKAMEEQLRIAAATFEGREGIFITDRNGTIVRVNRSFSQLTGYAESEVLGRTPALLKSGRYDPAFYRAFWHSLCDAGYWNGELWNRRKNGELYAQWTTISAVRDENGQITHYVSAFSDITEHKAAEEQIRHLAFYDPLTNLPNRRLFLDRFEQALALAERSDGWGSLMFLDLDRFKELNDRYGHVVGDQLLVEVARRLVACVRGSDTVARLGGDEFVVILQNSSVSGGQHVVREEAHLVADKIRTALAEPYELSEGRGETKRALCYRSTVSIGVTLFADGGTTRDELLREADVAMYAAKAAGRDAVRFYEPASGAAPVA